MNIRSIARWTLALLLMLTALIVTLAALNKPAAEAHRLNSIIPCSGSIQACINSAIDGDTIVIAAGDYTESLTLDKAVSLTGVDSATTILHALPNDRVLTVTVALTSSTIISGLTFMGGNLYDFTAGGIYAPVGSLTLLNSRIVSNTTTGVDANDAIIIGSQFLNNAQGLYVQHTLFSTDTSFSNNSEGAVYIDSGAATIYNGWFENNIATSLPYASSGGLWLNSGNLILSNTTFISNSFGGAIIEHGTATVYGGRFERNTNGWNGGYGGGLMNINGPVAVTDTIFISNSAGIGGGALGANGLQISGGRFEGNLAGNGYMGYVGGYGGGIINWGVATLTGTAFVGNRSNGVGGAMISDVALIDHAYFISNTATNIGGAILTGGTDACSVVIANTLFAANEAGDAGTILARDTTLSAPCKIELQHLTIADVGLNPTSAIEVSTGTLSITDTIIANHAIAINNTGATVYEDYNLFYGNLTNTVGSIITGGHSLTGDPKFIDPANDNYHLGFGSAAIDRGIDVGINTDLDGNPRPKNFGFDIGAYEYQTLIDRWYFPIIYKQ